MIILFIYLILFVSRTIQGPQPSFFIPINVNHTNYSSQRFVTSKLEKNSEPTNITNIHNTDLTSNNAEVNLSDKTNPLNKMSNSELSSSIFDINNLHTHDDDDIYDYQYDDSDDNTLKPMHNNNNADDKFSKVDHENHIDILDSTLANMDHDNNHVFINTSCNSTNNTLAKDHEIDDDDDNEFPEAGIMLDVPQLDTNKIRHHGDRRYEEKTPIDSFGDTAAESDDDLAIEYNFYDNQYPHYIKANGTNKNCEVTPRLLFVSIVCYLSITYKYNFFLL